MTEAPRIHVEAVSLGGCPVALYDDLGKFVLGIDFSCPPEQIAAAMETVFQESVDTGRWSRNDCRGHRLGSEEGREPARPRTA